MYHLYIRKFFGRQPIMAAEKMRQKSRLVYPPEIMQTRQLSRLQKISLEHNKCLYVVSILQQGIRKPSTDNIHSPQNYVQTGCQAKEKKKRKCMCLGLYAQKVLVWKQVGLFLLLSFFQHYIVSIQIAYGTLKQNLFKFKSTQGIDITKKLNHLVHIKCYRRCKYLAFQ